jgi:hypothetical protein
MLTCAAEIYPGRVVMLDANLFDVAHCSTGSPSTRSHYCVCLEVAPEHIFWLPINSGSSPGRRPIFREEKGGHPNWVNNPKKRYSQGVSYYYPTQVWTLGLATTCLASKHDLSTLARPNYVTSGCLERVVSECLTSITHARRMIPG